MRTKITQHSIRCDDNAEELVFVRADYGDGESMYELSIEDAYCGRGECVGLIGRFKRAWHAFWARPISYASICVEDAGRLYAFLDSCMEELSDDLSKEDLKNFYSVADRAPKASLCKLRCEDKCNEYCDGWNASEECYVPSK